MSDESEGGGKRRWQGIAASWLMDTARSYRIEIIFSLAFLVLTLIVFKGYFQYANPLGTDSMGLPFIITASEQSNDFFSTWISYSGLGFPDYPLPVYQMMYMTATSLGLSPLDIAKVLIISSFWFAGVSMFICARRLTGRSIPSVAAALVFSLNQVFLSQVIDGHYYFILGLALFPFMFMIVHGVLNGKRTRFDILLPAVFVAYGTLAPPNIVLIAALFLGLYALAMFIMRPYPYRRLTTSVALLALMMAFLGLSVLLANNIPTYSTSYPIQEAMRWSSHSLTDALTLKASENSFFFGNETSAWVQPPCLAPISDALAFLIPVLAFGSLLWPGRRRETLPLAIIAVFFIYLAKGPYEPLSGAFGWAFKDLPLLDTIRVFSRFSLFTAFAYGLLIAYLISELESRISSRSQSGRVSWAPKGLKGKAAATLAVLIGICLIVQSGAILNGAVGTFDLPTEYQAPFDWVGEHDGDYRILNLPYMADYHNGPSSYGYPNTTTIDPGIYSLMYTGKDTVYGSSTYDYWAFFNYIIDAKGFGYKEIPSIMGDSSSMRYIVVQTHTPSQELDDFLSMSGLTVVAEFEGSGMVLENANWSPRVSAYSNISLTTGGRDMLTTLAGMGLYSPGDEGLVFFDQLSGSESVQLLEMADHIFVANGDLTELYMELSEWSPEQVIMLSSLGTSHTTDNTTNWIQGKWPLKAGLTLNPTIYTMGNCSFTFTLDSRGAGSSMYLKLMRGPEAGNLSISIEGMPVQTYDASYPLNQMAWAELQMPDRTGPVKVTITNVGDGMNNLEQIVVANDEEMSSQVEHVTEVLAGHLDKLVYIYSASSYFGSGTEVLGEKGYGVSSIEDGVLTITAGDLLAGRQSALIVQMDEGIPATVTVGGQEAPSLSSPLSGDVFDLGELNGGEAVGIETNGTYGVAIFSGAWAEGVSSAVDVGYEHPSSGSYLVSIGGDGPVMLQVSESYNSWWSGKVDGSSVLHVPLGSIVNGYMIVDGNSTVIVEYQGKTTYMLIIGLLAVVLLAATSLIALKRYKSMNKDVGG